MTRDLRRSKTINLGQRGTWEWRFKSIQWKKVFLYQDYAVLGIALLMLPVVFYIEDHATPVIRTTQLYDAEIGFPHRHAQTIPSWAAALIPWTGMVLTLLWVEIGLFKHNQSITTALTAVLHFFFSSTSAFVLVALMTSTFKNLVGRPRPDFFARCKPDLSYSDKHSPVLHPGKFRTVNCTNPDLRKVMHGRYSFPSEHSSWAFLCAWYSAMYMIWSLYHRFKSYGPKRIYNTSILERIGWELRFMVVWVLVVGQIVFCWFIGAYRVIDNRHNVSDIIAGFFLGFSLSTLYLLRATGVYSAFMYMIDTEGPLEEARSRALSDNLDAALLDNDHSVGGIMTVDEA